MQTRKMMCCVHIVHRLSFYGQLGLLEQLNVASLSRPTVFLCSVTHCYRYTFGK